MGLDGNNGSVEVLDSVHEVIDENLSNLVEGVGTSREVGKDSGSNNKELKEDSEEVKVEEKCDQGTSYDSSNLVNHEVVETVIVIESVHVQNEYVNGEDRKLEVKADESGLSLVSMKAAKGVCEIDNDSCVIDMKCSSHKGFYESSQGERICRICHLVSGMASDATSVCSNASGTSGDLIQLGCACKDELGIAHVHCAEVWFKLKGNRLCEICGETAKNVSGVSNIAFMEDWNDRRFMDNGGNTSRRFGGCWRGQPFCNFLMTCLVIAFILPWFFHVNMF